jgi:hypothetical protein
MDSREHLGASSLGTSLSPYTCHTWRASTSDMEANRLGVLRSLHKTIPPSAGPDLNISCSLPASSTKSSIPRRDQGLHLMKGRVMPTIKGSCMLSGQRGEPTGMVKTRSASLYSIWSQARENKQGIRKMWYASVLFCTNFKRSLRATSTMMGRGAQRCTLPLSACFGIHIW